MSTGKEYFVDIPSSSGEMMEHVNTFETFRTASQASMNLLGSNALGWVNLISCITSDGEEADEEPTPVTHEEMTRVLKDAMAMIAALPQILPSELPEDNRREMIKTYISSARSDLMVAYDLLGYLDAERNPEYLGAKS